MAMLISRATGDFTAAATWGVADSATGSQLTNPSATTATTTSYVYSSAFTGTNTKVADGVVLFLNRVNTTGTFSVALSEDNGTTATREVTVNASDLPATSSWVFFKFGSTLTLDGGTDYKVGIKGSSAGNATVGRDGTAGNWARMVSTTDTAAPAAGDTMLVVGEWTAAGASSSYTVTMNNTATTDFGTGTASGGTPTGTNTRVFNGLQIGQNGTLTWGTSASTAYYLKLSGNVTVWSGGTYNMGTVATPCPRDSTMYLQFDNATDGDFGFNIMDNATVVMQGLSRTSGKDVWYCKLNTDEAVNSTSLGVDTDTGWLDNDGIAIASTTQTASQSEAGTLNGNAGASTLTVDGFAGTGGGLAFAHGGTSPIAAEIILLTRNVRISGASSTVTSYVCGVGTTGLSVDIDWVEFFWLGQSNPRAVQFEGLASGSSVNIQYSCIRDCEGTGFFQSGVNNIGTMVFSNNVLFDAGKTVSNASGIQTQSSNTSGTLTVTNNILILCGSGTSAVALNCGTVGAFTGNVIAGCRGPGISTGGSTTALSIGSTTIHSCSGGAGGISATLGAPLTIDGLTVWRNASNGVVFGSTTSSLIGSYITVTNSTFFGNSTYNIGMYSAFVSFDNIAVNADTTFGTSIGLRGLMGMYLVTITNSSFSVASGVLTAHSADIAQLGGSYSPMITLNNTTLASSTEVSNPQLMASQAYIKSSKHDKTEGAFKSWFNTGVIERDTTIYNTAAPSERLTPVSATVKLASGPRLVAVDDGSTVTINAYVRKSVVGDGAAYNGNQPRLMVRANPACGITSDTVLDTMTAAAGSWEQLTGTTAAVDADGALEFFVDCDGTAGWINVDDWSVS